MKEFYLVAIMSRHHNVRVQFNCISTGIVNTLLSGKKKVMKDLRNME